MKKLCLIFFTFTLVSVSNYVKAQVYWKAGGNGQEITSSNNIIGTQSNTDVIFQRNGQTSLQLSSFSPAAGINLPYTYISNALQIGGILGNSSIGSSALDITGNVVIRNNYSLTFGTGLSKYGKAGIIGYQITSPDALDIYGAGSTSTNMKIKFWNPGGASFTGNVGIGKSSGTYLLDIADRIHLSAGASGSAGLWLANYANNSDRAFIGMVDDNNVGFYGNGGAYWALSMNVNTGKTNIGGYTIKNQTNFDGEVYKLYVKGGIRTELVQVDPSDVWPDYVFDKDYKLSSLEEVNKFIKANNHLPSIPSAKEVKESGINLAEMDAKLLQKIEELTLYMIQLKQENDLLKEKVNTLLK